jgi:hypothetical protein
VSGVLLEVTANINGILSQDTPEPNGFPVNEVAEAIGWDDFDFVTAPGPLVAIIFDSDWPKKSCLTSGVTTIEVDGTFGGLPASRVLTYSEFISDAVYGGRPTFVNPIGGVDTSVSDISQIAVFLDDC